MHDIVARLHRGGFTICEAADIVVWIAELGKYERVAGLAYLEEYYQEALYLQAQKPTAYQGLRVGTKHR